MARLPRWAKLNHAGSYKKESRSKKKNYMDDDLNYDREDEYLCQRAYLRASEILDMTLQSSMEETLHDVIQDVHSFFNRFLPQDDNNNNEMEQDRSSKVTVDGNNQSRKRTRDASISSTNEEDTFKKQPKKVCGGSSSSSSSSSSGDKSDVMVDEETNNTALNPTSQLIIHPNDFFYFPPTILPIAKINCSFSLLDRKEMVRIFIHGMESVGKGRHALVHLRDNYITTGDSKKNTNATTHSIFLHEILNQCILQETNSNEFLHLLSLKYKNNIQYLEQLVEWAGKTQSFDTIIVIFENIEVTSLHCMDSFIGVLSALRSTYGIPISLVLFSVSPQIDDKLNSLSRCNINENVEIKDFHTKSSEYILDTFFQQLYIDHCCHQFKLPIVLRGINMKKIRENFHDIHRSVATVVMHIKMALSYHFCSKGSFLAMIDDEDFCMNNWQRLAFFCVDSTAQSRIIKLKTKEYNLNSFTLFALLKENSENMRLSCLKLVIFKILSQHLPILSESSLIANKGLNKGQINGAFDCNSIIESFFTHSLTYKDKIQKIYDLLRTITIHGLLGLLSELREEVQNFLVEKKKNNPLDFFSEKFGNSIQTSNKNDPINNLLELLNESIILLDEIEKKSKSIPESLIHEFREDMSKRIMNFLPIPSFLGSRKNPFTRHSCLQNNMNCENGIYTTEDFLFLNAQPRRMVAASLSEKSDEFCLIKGGGADACIIFGLMENRVISTSDWLEKFINEIVEENSQSVCDQEKLLERFVFGVYQLIFCGMITRSRTRDDAFEKCALVWSRST